VPTAMSAELQVVQYTFWVMPDC